MPKMKTRKAMRSKFKVTATGKLIMHHPGKSHLLTKKSSKRKMHLRKSALVTKCQVKMYRKLISV